MNEYVSPNPIASKVVENTRRLAPIVYKTFDTVEEIALGVVCSNVAKRLCPADAKWYVKLAFRIGGFALGETLGWLGHKRIEEQLADCTEAFDAMYAQLNPDTFVEDDMSDYEEEAAE